MGPNRQVRGRRLVLSLVGGFLSLVLLWLAATLLNWNPRYRVGQEIDRLNGVAVFYNGGVGHSAGRNLAPDGYNLGVKYQCVEFVKRYYYERLSHKMPDSYGHAKQFFDATLPDGARNPRRGLLQYANGSQSRPRPDDLLVFGPSLLNRYGHVAIVSTVNDFALEIVQQNPGPFGSSRVTLPLRSEGGRWRCQNGRVLGWLRKEPSPNALPASGAQAHARQTLARRPHAGPRSRAAFGVRPVHRRFPVAPLETRTMLTGRSPAGWGFASARLSSCWPGVPLAELENWPARRR